MAEEEVQVVELQDNFYRDSFGKIIFLICSIILAIAALVSVSVYLYIKRPPPITFAVYDDWRIQNSVPLDKPYLLTPDLLQWVSQTILKIFVYDFYHYNNQLSGYQQYFTADGWKVFLNQLSNYASYDKVLAGKLFINGVPTAAPYIINQGLLSGRYGWWIDIPININFTGGARAQTLSMELQLLVVRVSTLNNLAGVAIDNVIVVKNQNGSVTGNG